jgi:hypothetical protein
LLRTILTALFHFSQIIGSILAHAQKESMQTEFVGGVRPADYPISVPQPLAISKGNKHE